MTPTVRNHRLATVGAAALSAVIILLGIARISDAGFTARTDNDGAWQSGTVSLTDDDASSVMFSTATEGLLDGGQSLTRCIAVTYTGSITSNIGIRTHATSTGALAPFLDLTVEEGTGGGAGSCAGFTAASTLYTGTLAGYSNTHSTFANGAGEWGPPTQGQTLTYRFTATVQNVPAAQSTSATATFTWEAATTTFSPASLAGKALWLRAKDNPGASGSAVTTWADRSGGQRDGIAAGTAPTVTTGATPSGGRAIRFAGAGGYNIASLGLAMYTSAHSSLYPGQPSNFAVDGNTGTYWRSNVLPATLSLTPRQPYAETSYTLTPSTLRHAQNFTFEGSNDGTTWTVLDTRNGVTWPTTTPQTFTFANSTTYSTYRLNVTAAVSYTQVSIAEITLNTNPVPAATAGELWIVVKSQTQGAATISWDFGGNGTHPRYLNAFANIESDFGLTATRAFPPTMPVTTWRIHRVTTNGTTWAAYLDGALQFSAANLPVVWPHVASIGKQSPDGGSAVYFTGDIAEVLVRDRVSTAAEATKITAYLNSEHGLAIP